MTISGNRVTWTSRPLSVPLVLLWCLVVVLPSTTQAIRFLGTSRTYARYPPWHACPNASLSFEFKTRQPSAMLVYTDDNGRYDFLQLELTKGAVRLFITFISEENRYVDIEANTEPLNDGRWHQVEIRRNRMETVLYVDGTQTSKVALGSDSDVGLDLTERTNYVFFGGVPSNYGQRRPEQFTNKRFRGEMRNILYFNCSCIPRRASMVNGQDVSQDEPEACEVNNPCPVDCPCVSADDGSGCECAYKRECLKDLLASYVLPMDEIDGQALVNPSGLDSTVEGNAQLVPGVHNKAVRLNGRSQWVRVTGADHRRECMGDLARCEKGYYMAMWIQFSRASNQLGVYLSNGGHSATNHGVALLYSSTGRLDVIFKMADGREWRARTNDVLQDRWYHVAATWAEDKGLFIYINGELRGQDKRVANKTPVNGNSRYNGFYIGRANDNTGTTLLGEILVDDFMFESSFKTQKEVREAGSIYHYYLPMEEIRQDRLEGKGLEGRVFGAASQVDGKVGNGVLLSGGREYLDLGDVSDTCLGDLDLCRYGVYVSMWLMFNRVDGGRKALVASPAVGLHQDGTTLIASVKNLRQSWETRYRGLMIGEWYFVELSWTLQDGISLYVDRQKVAHQPAFTYRAPEPMASMNLYVGRDAARGSSYPAVTVDELQIYTADRGTLIDIDFIERGRPQNYHVSMDATTDEVARGLMLRGGLKITMEGTPRLVEGRVGSALSLDGLSDALDFGSHGYECFGNLDHCPHGMMLSLWLRPERLEDEAYFLSSGVNGLSLRYSNKKLQVRASTTNKVWEVSTSDFPADKWHFLEVSFHLERGLRLYLNSNLVAESDQAEVRTQASRVGLDRFYLGRSDAEVRGSQHGAGTYDELDMWYADRDYLTAQGFIQRSRPESVVVHFEEASQDQSRINHQTLDIRLTGQPRLVPGKIGYALELPGNGRYADLGQLSGTCMGNLARCPQGITVSAWMKFRSFGNNMVFLSTGLNGLLLLFKDGYVLASADGRDQVLAPTFETNRWYFVELSWHPSHGLKLFVDNKQVQGNSRPYTYPDNVRDDDSHFYIGRPNSGDVPGGRYLNGDFDIDELEVWYARREDLLAFGYIDRDALGCESFPMDSMRGDVVNHPKYILRLQNGATLVPGRAGRALRLNGRGQYLDMGVQVDSCLGNLDLCPHGFTLSVWLKPNNLTDNMHFIAAPSFFLFYEDRRLNAVFNSEGRSWTVGTSNFRVNEWQRVTLTWHAAKGLRMFINDQLVDASGGRGRVRSNPPASTRLFLGRNLADTRMTANVDIDELQICDDDLDQLRAVGSYKVEVIPVILSFDSLRNGNIILRNRQINAIGDIVLRDGLTSNSKALYLNGLNQYLDFGENFTCNGNLDSCREGVTFRLAVRPDRLEDGMYFVDSFPIKLYYRNGQLHGEMQTPTHVWRVVTDDFKQGQWSRVEMTWHPTQGLALYINGQRVDYQIYPNRRDPVTPRSWATYLGRPLSFADGTYANMYVDNMEFYNAYRSYVNDDTYLVPLRSYLRELTRVTTRPVTSRPVVTTRSPILEPRTTLPQVDQGKTRIIHLNGAAYVNFDFNRLPSKFLEPTQSGEFALTFLTEHPDGLIWHHQENSRSMSIAMKDGHLVFVYDNKTGHPNQVVIGRREGVRFNDFEWHRLKIRRNGRRIQLTVDDKHREDYMFPEDVQFLTGATVWLGGTRDTSGKTGGIVKKNFNGGIADVIYITNQRQGQRIIRNEVNLMNQLSQGSMTGNVITEIITDPPAETTTKPPDVRRTTSVSVVNSGVFFEVPSLALRSGSSITFNFKTLSQDGLMLFGGDPQTQYITVELVDGRLHFIHLFGRQPHRTPFSQKIVADGQNHEVEVRFYPTHVDLRVDDIRERVELVSGEQLPSNLGTLFVAGVPDYEKLPWIVWSQEGYLGCFNDLRVDSRIIDFESWVKELVGSVNRGCIAVSQECTLRRPCLHGQCHNTMVSSLCDCSRTAFRGPLCNLDAWTALFNGSIWGQLDFTSTLKSHRDDLSLRFRSPAKDGLLFETFTKASNDFLRASMENGRIKVETNLGGQLKTMYAGDNLNDLQWHTLYIQRRGNEIAAWVDDSPHTKTTLAGDGYYLNIDRLNLGGVDGSNNRYIGYLQNFYLGDMDILQQMRGTKLNVNSFQALPALIYYAVTFPDLNSYVSMAPLSEPQAMVLHFMFKTKEPSGILVFTSGSNQAYLVVELFEGNLFIQFSGSGSEPLRVTSAQKVNNDRWHAVTIQRVGGDQRQFLLTVDGVTSSVTYDGREGLNLNGPVFVGGVPREVLQRDYIKNAVFSRTGFRGCLASMDFSGKVSDLGKLAKQQGVTVYDSCRPIISRACTADSCKNFGKCIESGADSFSCNCKMSAHRGSACTDEPIGFRYQNFSTPSKEQPGLLVYTFPLQPSGTSRDEIAFGVMTRQDEAILLRVFSEVFKDFIEFKLRNGYVEVNYDTDGAGGKHTVSQRTQKVNDGKVYHIVRFIRTSDKATLYVDNQSVTNSHHTTHGNFDRMNKMYIGGGYDSANGKIIEGFDGIIGGLHINGLLVFPQAKAQLNTIYYGDVVEAPRPFNLTFKGRDIHVIPGPTTTPKPIVTTPPPTTSGVPSAIPNGVGGAGIGWVPGSGGVDSVVYPGGDSGTGVLVPGGAGFVEGSPVYSAMAASSLPLPGPGARAGAVAGTVLGLLALASALMWAFVRCKPGWCTCLKPPAEAVVSPPLLSASNKGAVLAAGGGVSGAGGFITGMGEGAGLEGSAAGTGAKAAGGGLGGSFTNFYLTSGSSTGGGGGGGATATSAGGYSGNFQESSAQMRSIGSSVSDGVDGAAVLSPVSLQSYRYEGAGESTTADYDLVTGVHPGYQSNTLSTRGGSVSGGSIGPGGFSSNTMQSTNTMQSSYNYSVRNVRTVSGKHQMMGYADSNIVGVPPGALGEEVRVDCCLITNDGHSVVTGSSLGPPQVWDMQSGELLRMMQGEAVGSTNLHLACNDSLLVGAINADLEANQLSVPKGVNNYTLQIWDFVSGRAFDMVEQEVCSALTMMSDNDKVVFARTDKFGGGTDVVVWDLMGNQSIKDMRYDAPVGNNDFVNFLALSRNDRYVIAGFTNSFDNFAEFIVFDMTLSSYAIASPAILRLDANPDCTAVLPHDEAVTGMRNGELIIWSMRTGQPSRQLMAGSGRHAHTHEVKAVAVSEDGKYLVSGSADGTVKLWDMGAERHINTFNGHTDEVWCCAISADNEIVVSGSRDQTIRLWKLKHGTEMCSFSAGVDIFHITMSRDKSTIVALGDKLGARKLVMLQVMRTKVRRQLDD